MFSINVGRAGEDFAAGYLKSKGYEILFRNFYTKFGELDIVCRKNRELIFIEVKAAVIHQGAGFDPEQHFTEKKISRLKRAIEIFLIKNKISDQIGQRLDLIAIELGPGGKPEDLRHYENVSDIF